MCVLSYSSLYYACDFFIESQSADCKPQALKERWGRWRYRGSWIFWNLYGSSQSRNIELFVSFTHINIPLILWVPLKCSCFLLLFLYPDLLWFLRWSVDFYDELISADCIRHSKCVRVHLYARCVVWMAGTAWVGFADTMPHAWRIHLNKNHAYTIFCV